MGGRRASDGERKALHSVVLDWTFCTRIGEGNLNGLEHLKRSVDHLPAEGITAHERAAGRMGEGGTGGRLSVYGKLSQQGV